MHQLIVTCATIFSFLISTLPAAAQNTVEQDAEKLAKFIETIDSKYVDSVGSTALVEVAIKSVLEELDPHSVYYTKEQLEKANEALKGNFEGIGVTFQMVDDTMTIVSPIAGGPSAEVGIMPGDQIIKVEDQTVAGVDMGSRAITELVKGPKGTKIRLLVRRPDAGEEIVFDVRRDEIPIYSIDASYMVTPHTGYVKLNKFAATSVDEFETALNALQNEGMDNLILDLRGNSGGYLNTAIKLADHFLEERKMIVYTEGKNQPRREVLANNGGMFAEGKLAILIDEGSASASEILAGAVQDWDRGLIIGRRSFGKGLVQKPYYFSDGSAMRLTVSRYYTPTGRSIQRPYDEGREAYRDEVSSRYGNGELFSLDSIDISDSLKYYTPGNRVVYGGGGILPDIFVPLDTTGTTDYIRDARRKNLFNTYALRYTNKNRKTLLAEYKNVTDFERNFHFTEEELQGFVAYASGRGVADSPEEVERSMENIQLTLKETVARDLWGTSAFYQIHNGSDPAFLKAVHTLEQQGPVFLGLKAD